MNNLQEIYTNIKNSTDSQYSEGFESTSSHFVELINNNKDLSEDDLKLLILKQSNGIADAGQWGGCSRDQFVEISNKWSNIYSILKEGKKRRLTSEEYLNIRNIIKTACSKDKKIITNRIFAAFFPNEISATCKEEDFYLIVTELKKNYPDYPKITDNWLLDNYAFVDFCKKNLIEDKSLPIPVFSWKLRDAIKNGIMNKDTNIAKDKTTMNPYIILLENNKNLILHGAPGTGKTYTAKDIAAQMICGKSFSQIEAGSEDDKLFNEQTEFVQFHPSYDYSDFIEGLRPIEGENTGDVGFERKDGVFKEFCEKALKSRSIGGNDNYDNAWTSFVNELNEKETVTIKTLNKKAQFTVYLNQNGDGLVDKQEDYSRFYNYQQLYNVYRGLPGVPNRGHDNYRLAVIKYLKENHGLTDYEKGSEDKNNKKKYIFIIDEINRGEMSKIFGELFFSIDPDYRGPKGKVRTQYANMLKETNVFDEALGITSSYGHFFVPENIYIIGTMNDIDRSVDSMDFAMRRRFTFVELKANECLGILDNLQLSEGISKSDILAKMSVLNNEIEKIPGLSSAYHIGGSYFAKLSKYSDKSKSEAFECLWNNHLKPLITDYLRGLPNLEAKLANFKAKYDAAGVVSEESDK